MSPTIAVNLLFDEFACVAGSWCVTRSAYTHVYAQQHLDIFKIQTRNAHSHTQEPQKKYPILVHLHANTKNSASVSTEMNTQDSTISLDT